MLVAKFQTQGVDHASHFGVANLTPLQVRPLYSSSNYDPRRRIKRILRTLACTRSDVEKWLCFLRKCGISRP
jgi:hypothetical protein